MNNQVKPMVMVIATVLLSAIFSFLNIYEFVVVGLLKRTEGYPFGDEGPMPWYYESAELYAVVTCIWGIVFFINADYRAVGFYKAKVLCTGYNTDYYYSPGYTANIYCLKMIRCKNILQ